MVTTAVKGTTEGEETRWQKRKDVAACMGGLPQGRRAQGAGGQGPPALPAHSARHGQHRGCSWGRAQAEAASSAASGTLAQGCQTQLRAVHLQRARARRLRALGCLLQPDTLTACDSPAL